MFHFRRNIYSCFKLKICDVVCAYTNLRKNQQRLKGKETKEVEVGERKERNERGKKNKNREVGRERIEKRARQEE